MLNMKNANGNILRLWIRFQSVLKKIFKHKQEKKSTSRYALFAWCWVFTQWEKRREREGAAWGLFLLLFIKNQQSFWKWFLQESTQIDFDPFNWLSSSRDILRIPRFNLITIFHLFLFHLRPIYQISMPSIATPTHWEFIMSILKNNVWVSLLRTWIFGIWTLTATGPFGSRLPEGKDFTSNVFTISTHFPRSVP